MKIISVTMVKNECDIIESFVKYHCNIFDEMIILDNGSTDSTVDILTMLQYTFPIHIMYDNRSAYAQDKITTDLAKLAINKYNADIVIPIDSDEFIFSKEYNVREYLLDFYKDNNSLLYLPWVTYIPTKEDNASEVNPIKRLTYRKAEEGTLVYKVIFSKNINKEDFLIKQGNHDLLVDHNIDEKEYSNKLFYAHFPIRSSNQALSKYVIGWLANLANHNNVLFDWYPYYKLSKNSIANGLSISEIKDMAINYNSLQKNFSNNLISDPLDVNFSLEYTCLDCNNPINNILNYSQTLAQNHGYLLTGKEYLLSENNNILNLISNYLEIDGWLSPLEAVNLYKIVAKSELSQLNIVEIGTWQGKSSFILAKALKDTNKKGKVYCIDPFNGDGDSFSKDIYIHNKNNLLDKFIQNMKKNNIFDFIVPMPGYSDEIYKDFNNDIDILFIDGNHDYENVVLDYTQWSPKIKIGGYIMFHDVGSYVSPGPREVVNEYIMGNDSWNTYSLYDELLIAKKIR